MKVKVPPLCHMTLLPEIKVEACPSEWTLQRGVSPPRVPKVAVHLMTTRVGFQWQPFPLTPMLKVQLHRKTEQVEQGVHVGTFLFVGFLSKLIHLCGGGGGGCTDWQEGGVN